MDTIQDPRVGAIPDGGTKVFPYVFVNAAAFESRSMVKEKSEPLGSKPLTVTAADRALAGVPVAALVGPHAILTVTRVEVPLSLLKLPASPPPPEPHPVRSSPPTTATVPKPRVRRNARLPMIHPGYS